MVDTRLVVSADVGFGVKVWVAGPEGVCHLEAGGDLDPEEEFCGCLGRDGEPVTVWVWGYVEVTDDVDCTCLGACRVYLGDEFVKPVVISCQVCW